MDTMQHLGAEHDYIDFVTTPAAEANSQLQSITCDSTGLPTYEEAMRTSPIIETSYRRQES
jgi:hypothetical protein